MQVLTFQYYPFAGGRRQYRQSARVYPRAMGQLDGRDAAAALDAVYELAAVRYLGILPREAARLAYDLVPCDRAGWVVMDLAAGTVQGTHWPMDIPQLLGLMPPDLAEVPLVAPLVESSSAVVLRISDVWSGSEWRSTRIYSELYGPLGVEYQAIAMISISGAGGGARLDGLSLVRHDRDFSDRERDLLAEFGRHVRAAARRLRAPGDIDRAIEIGLTVRQAQALLSVAGGATMPLAAASLGVSAKTLGNHLQAAYERLGVSGRLAALALLRNDDKSQYAAGDIPR